MVVIDLDVEFSSKGEREDFLDELHEQLAEIWADWVAIGEHGETGLLLSTTDGKRLRKPLAEFLQSITFDEATTGRVLIERSSGTETIVVAGGLADRFKPTTAWRNVVTGELVDL